MLARIWLFLRHPYSWLINQFYRSERKPLPTLFDFESVKEALSQIKWTVDTFGDWIQQPEVTWGLKTGDCEDFAVLTQALLRQIGIESSILSVIMRPMKYSHAVCVFRSCDYWHYFSNGKLVYQGFDSLHDIVEKLRGKNKVIFCKLEKGRCSL